MKNKVASTIKTIAIVFAVLIFLAGLILSISEDVFLIFLISALLAGVCGVFTYAIGEAIQLLQDIKDNTSSMKFGNENDIPVFEEDIPEI